MKNVIVFSSFAIAWSLMSSSLNAQDGMASTTTVCNGYPQDEVCCLKNRGVMVSDDSTSFCYLNLRTSKVTKANCMEAGGHAYWRNDSTILCLPKGIMVMSGNVTAIDENAKTISLVSEGTMYSLVTPWANLPKEGEYIDVYYKQEPDGTLHGKSCHLIVQ